ncbi:T9SS type A sorting domain-containing protein [Aequorivita echinoideorum]|uniref:T9SS type A sorting domain-containing protein n=1 Tax=Aequorivita echinoideorum TaxID=1549647 RepID=A0ABS5S4D7_9FLAO|nr:T9SS type A sorting domain-containing protein [Aequorivita echinoideorum]MBT0606715.1 T9SS type A sorting domain-containing protein [Aequorivita echinoideorum]
MKKLLQIAAIALTGALATAQTNVNLSMGAGYTDEVYYKLSTEETNTYTAASWDIAFLRISPMDISIRVNDGIGIQVFEAADSASDFDNIDVADEASWTPLFNDDTNWENGAFMQGSATYGWGEYNPVSHHVEGTIVFVLKYADGTYRKFINEDYFGGYTFKYATWNGTAWVGETTTMVANSSNPDNRYNYYSLQNNAEVVAEPAQNNWDFVFRKYNTYLDPPGENYIVTGTLHNPNVTVAQNDEPSGAGNPNGLFYSEEINTIGSDWKSFDGSGYSVNSDVAYYVKYDENTVYRVVFDSFEGSSTGNFSFNYEDVSGLLGLENISEGVTFGIYPNPSTSKIVNIVYDLKNSVSQNNSISVYNIQGQLVHTSKVDSNNGFYNKSLDLSALSSGMYLVRFSSGNQSITKKLILK